MALDHHDEKAVVEAIRLSFRPANTVDAANHPFLKLFREYPQITIISGLSDFLFEVSRSSPRDIDAILHIARHAEADDSLPTVYWASSRPTATFRDVFVVDFSDKMRGYLEEPSDRRTFLAASLLSGRSIGLNVMSSPDIVGVITDSLKLSETLEWSGDIASTGVAGACLQLLGGYSGLPSYLHNTPGKVLEALKKLNVSKEDEPLLQFTIANLENPHRHDLTSEEILVETSSAGWKFWNGA
jgi:hypothetical protein